MSGKEFFHHILFFFFGIYLAALGLSCGTWDRPSLLWHTEYLVVA